MSALEDFIQGTLRDWNAEVADRENKFQFEIKASVRTKKVHVNKNDFVEKEIMELLFLHKKTDPSEKDFLLWRREYLVPPKQKGKSIVQRNNTFKDFLYKNLMYEMMGVFALTTKQTIITQDYAEYDIEKDRIKQHESAVDMVIKTLVAGPFFEVGNEFDVFMDLEGEYYAVYTEHEFGRKNNGIARIPKKDCLVIQAAKKQIILL